ncbi:hypothetical protein RIVM261_078000 [Rivularia sp. IAM M-261]|nr:hypothetical protein RIVM261_078000 [Rivularia sp. IAM M-261]
MFFRKHKYVSELNMVIKLYIYKIFNNLFLIQKFENRCNISLFSRLSFSGDTEISFNKLFAAMSNVQHLYSYKRQI